jgi:hypothetical protein
MHHLVNLIVVPPVKLIVSLLGSNSNSTFFSSNRACSVFEPTGSGCNDSRKVLTTLALSLQHHMMFLSYTDTICKDREKALATSMLLLQKD